jgi:hypothetical protein
MTQTRFVVTRSHLNHALTKRADSYTLRFPESKDCRPSRFQNLGTARLSRYRIGFGGPC